MRSLRYSLFCIACLLAVFQSASKEEAVTKQRVNAGEVFETGFPASGSIAMQAISGGDTFVSFSVQTTNENVSLLLKSPDGYERQKNSWRTLPTDFSAITKSGGKWTLSILCKTKFADCGRVRGTVSIRPANEMDAERIRAEHLFDEAVAFQPGSERTGELQAVDRYGKAAAIWAHTGNRLQEALAYLQIGQSFVRTGDTEQALKSLQKASDCSREGGVPELQSSSLSEIGVILAMEGNEQEGYEACEQALELAELTEAPGIAAKAHNCLGEVEYHKGNILSSLKLFKEAEALQRKQNNTRDLAENLLDIGTTYCDLSRYAEADPCFQESLSISQSLNDNHGKGLALVAIGRMHDQQGQYQESLSAFHQALNLIEPMGDPTWTAAVEGGIGSVYDRMGNLEQAIAHFDKALVLFRKAGVKIAEIDVLLGIGRSLLAGGRIDQAQERVEEALALCKDFPNPAIEALALHLMGMINRKRGEPVRAIAYYKAALPLFEQTSDQQSEAELYMAWGQAYEDIGNRTAAINSYLRAVNLSKQSRDLATEASSHYLLAHALAIDGRPAAALQQIESAVNLAESLRGSVESREMRASYVDSNYRFYELKIELLMRLVKESPKTGLIAAFETSERAKARSLMDSLSEARIDIRQGVDPVLLENERDLLGRITYRMDHLIQAANKRRGREDIVEIERDIDNLVAQLDLVKAEIRSRSPNYAAITQPQPLGLDAIQHRLLDPDTLLLEYSLGEQRSFLWLVSSEGCTAFILPERSKIEAEAASLYELMTARLRHFEESLTERARRLREAGSRYLQEAGSLSEMILRPLAGSLGEKRLLIVSDGALQYIPFAALPDPEISGDPVPMIAHHEIVHLPSASTLEILREATEHRKPAEAILAVLADPVFESEDPRVHRRMEAKRNSPATQSAEIRGAGIGSGVAIQSGWTKFGKLSLPRLISTYQEAKKIVAEAPAGKTMTAVGFDARRDILFGGQLSNYQYVHFATHAVVDGDHPEFSGIFLSMVDPSGKPSNGFVKLHDIYNLSLPAEMIVLSACNTALGQNLRGEGLVGFVRGFFYAGARRVVASLWKVDDEATMELMTRFYRKIFREQLSPAAALRHAQLEMWQRKRWKEPFFWAAFILQGEWK